MKIKKLTYGMLVCCLANVSNHVSGAPLVSVGDNVDVFFTGSAGIRYQSNLFYTENNEESDTILTFTPGFDIRVGKPVNALHMVLSLHEEFTMYSDNDDLDANNDIIRFKATFNDPVIKADFKASYVETDQTTPDLARNNRGSLIEREISQVGSNVEYTFSPKTSFGFGFQYADTNYGSAGGRRLLDRESFSIPLDFYYKYSPKLDLSVGYRYRNTEVDKNGNDSEDHFLNIGVRGELTPKLDGQIRVGIQDRSNDNSSDDTGFSILSRFIYAASLKTSVTADITRDYDTGGVGSSIERTGAAFGVKHQFSTQISGNVRAGYENSEYDDASNREDDYFYFSTGLSYSPNEYWTFSTSYSYQDNDSDTDAVATSSFENNVVNVRAALRY